MQVDERIYATSNDGDVICDKLHPCEVAKKFVVYFVCSNDCQTVLTIGYEAMIHINTSTSSCQITKVIGILNTETKKIDYSLPKIVKPG